MSEQTEQAIAVIEAAEVLIEAAGKFRVIRTEDEASLAAEFRARVNQQIKDLDAERLEMGDGARKTLDLINAKYNEPITRLKAQLGSVDQAIRGYLADQKALREAAERAQREQEAARKREEEKRLEDAIAARRAAEAANLPPPPEPEPLPPPPPAIVIPEAPRSIGGSYGSKTSLRENWKYRIVDIKKVPEDFLVPVEDRVNKSALNALARSMKANAKVKGVEFYSEDSLTSRVVS